MAGEVIVDALPYIDHGYDDPGVRESALALVEEECRRYRPTKNYLDHLPPITTNAFETKLMAAEFERIQNRQPMETLSMKRYELPPPPAGKLSEVAAWQEAIENSMAQLEHQWVRAMNLELMLDFGIESWKAYLEVFTAMQAKAQTQLQELKKEIQDVNWKRKQAQTEAGEKLRTLEANWVLLVSKNYEIEQHCAEMEKQLYQVRAHSEQLDKSKQHEKEQQVAAAVVEEEQQQQMEEDTVERQEENNADKEETITRDNDDIVDNGVAEAKVTDDNGDDPMSGEKSPEQKSPEQQQQQEVEE